MCTVPSRSISASPACRAASARSSASCWPSCTNPTFCFWTNLPRRWTRFRAGPFWPNWSSWSSWPATAIAPRCCRPRGMKNRAATSRIAWVDCSTPGRQSPDSCLSIAEAKRASVKHQQPNRHQQNKRHHRMRQGTDALVGIAVCVQVFEGLAPVQQA